MEPEPKKQFFFWFVFVLFLLYIFIWLIILFGLPPSVLEMIFSFPSEMSKYLLVDWKSFGKNETGKTGKTGEMDNAMDNTNNITK
jgi:hypothetical protein